MTEKTAREQLREAASAFAKKSFASRPEPPPDALLALEAELGLPEGQALAELIVAYFDRRMRGTTSFPLPQNPLTLCRAVLIALDLESHAPQGPHLNERGRHLATWHREITMAALNGKLGELEARDEAEREEAKSKVWEARRAAGKARAARR